MASKFINAKETLVLNDGWEQMTNLFQSFFPIIFLSLAKKFPKLREWRHICYYRADTKARKFKRKKWPLSTAYNYRTRNTVIQECKIHCLLMDTCCFDLIQGTFLWHYFLHIDQRYWSRAHSSFFNKTINTLKLDISQERSLSKASWNITTKGKRSEVHAHNGQVTKNIIWWY